jgi:hypothetical protein
MPRHLAVSYRLPRKPVFSKPKGHGYLVEKLSLVCLKTMFDQFLWQNNGLLYRLHRR